MLGVLKTVDNKYIHAHVCICEFSTTNAVTTCTIWSSIFLDSMACPGWPGAAATSVSPRVSRAIRTLESAMSSTSRGAGCASRFRSLRVKILWRNVVCRVRTWDTPGDSDESALVPRDVVTISCCSSLVTSPEEQGGVGYICRSLFSASDFTSWVPFASGTSRNSKTLIEGY